MKLTALPLPPNGIGGPYGAADCAAAELPRQPSTHAGEKGQATTEVVLLFPIFMFFLFAFAKIFALLILVQKMEVASYYAARRWQLESHRNVDFEGFDAGALQDSIQQNVSSYLGFGTSNESFLDLVHLTGPGAKFACDRTQVWNVCTLTVKTKPLDIAWMYHSPGFTFEVTKYVPNRDRPIAFVLPGGGGGGPGGGGGGGGGG